MKKEQLRVEREEQTRIQASLQRHEDTEREREREKEREREVLEQRYMYMLWVAGG